MPDSFGRSLEKLAEKLPESTREVYLDYLARVLRYSVDKFEHRQTKNNERISWGRLIVQATSSGSDILRDVDLDEIRLRLQKLEERLGK